MSCCTKDNTKDKVKDDKKSCCNSEQTENLNATTSERSGEECDDKSCKIHHGEDSQQKSGSEGCCD